MNRIIETFDGKFIFTQLSGAYYIKIWSSSLPYGEVFRLWLPLKNSLVLVDEKEEKWLYNVLVKDPKPDKRYFWSLACQPYCHNGLKRLHLTCLRCRIRRIFRGKVGNPIKIGLYFAPVYLDRETNPFREFLSKNLHSLAEFISGV